MPATRTSPDSQRLLARRQHKILGLYLAVGAWSNNLNAVVLERASFTRFLSLERIKKARIKQFKEDIKDWFPFVEEFYQGGDTLHSIYLSRLKMTHYLSKEKMNTAERIKRARGKGLAIAEWRHVCKDITSINEEEVISFSALLAAGLASPQRGDFSVTLLDFSRETERINRQKLI